MKVFSVKQRHHSEAVWTGGKKGKEANCGLHPLIHTRLKFALTQDVEKKKIRAEAPQWCSEV
jgi:hypothetical protein